MAGFGARYRKQMILALGLVALAGGSIATRSAAGHGAVIRLASPTVAAGDSLAMRGEGLGERAEITIALEGATGTTRLAILRGDDHGRFETSVRIPSETPPGAYRVVATAGEDRATAELLVTAAEAAAVPASSHDAHSTTEATAEDMDLDRHTTPLEKGFAWGGVALLVVFGAYLKRRPRFQ